MDTERLGIDPSGIGRNDGEEGKEMKAQHQPNNDYMLRYAEHLMKEAKRGDGYQVVTPKVLVDVDNLRLNGKHYGTWRCSMEEHVLDNLRGVIYGPRPSFVVETDASVEEIARSMAAEEKWNEYDTLCFHTILNHLCDDLFLHYSKRRKETSAKQLWDELQLRFGAHESRVQKYMEFDLLEEEEPMWLQAQEMGSLFFYLVRCNKMEIDEEFHVNAIISKLPPSWEDVCIELMREEHLPVTKLIHRLIVEQQSRIN
ncbi:PREDICTED: UBN2_2 domain-containing [Prunus dulcis]|uniref:PREDICTED: UBN2_2 domain-containing n=1 Tax=Prunus dulcis TaxID=3755 RepID=A0A5E4FGU8_PRUDU|nr:uncharacterized protein LOC117619636 [Prunus dulcis]XP_034205535.1 uncharacterized protein LOC117619645 [Prunus dulcis]KAI5345840.1 hypothetical protein L3X38_013717 [Prunus dulcis]VVA27383.1 PREDICTED: UBN2_2 domain-containing [Prunus dulcis]VVA27417.1 PREDICTED: UBN2_2 domain-containing [Prunus dulcis]